MNVEQKARELLADELSHDGVNVPMDKLVAIRIEPALRAEIADIRMELDATIEQRDLLSQEVLRLERDADRYRWLRDESDDFQWRAIGEAKDTNAAIDAARQQESSNGQ